jgi:hypothetical protein
MGRSSMAECRRMRGNSPESKETLIPTVVISMALDDMNSLDDMSSVNCCLMCAGENR